MKKVSQTNNGPKNIFSNEWTVCFVDCDYVRLKLIFNFHREGAPFHQTDIKVNTATSLIIPISIIRLQTKNLWYDG